MDLIVSTKRFPASGETVIGTDFSTAPGGKGANQAVQAARLGAAVTMIGKVGEDDFGKQLLDSAKNSGVDISRIKICSDAPSAIGNVQLEIGEKHTANRIIVVPGANMKLTVDDVAFLAESISDYDMVMLQHEIPTQVNLAVARFAKKAGVPVMLNPAPAADVPSELISCLTYISPNEHEAFDIIGIAPDSSEKMTSAVEKLRELGVSNVLITLGKDGCVFSDGTVFLKGDCVDSGAVVDSTAAGDSFMGAFCTAVAFGIDVETAMLIANCTAGITVSRMGAQTSLPTHAEVLEVMRKNGFNTTEFEKIAEAV